MSKVIYEAETPRYIVEMGFPGYGTWASTEYEWEPVKGFDDSGWAQEYARVRAYKEPRCKWRVVDTEAEDA